MRYLIVSAQYLPHTGGVETFTARLAEQLRAEGDDVRILTSAVEGEPERSVQPNGVEVLRVPTHQLMGGRLPMLVHGRRTSSMVRELRAQGADRVLVNTRFYDLSFVGVSLANKIGAPCVVLDHGSDYLTLNNGLADAAIRAFEHVQTRALMGRRPRFAGISDMSACWLERFGIHTSAVIPNAIDARAFRELSSGRDYRSELGLDPSQPIVAFVGRLMAEKGALPLAAAAELLAPEGVQVLMAGEGSDAHEIERLGYRSVHVLGKLDQPDLSALYAQSALFCLPTRSEGFCTALLEAGAWGVPAVIPRVGGTFEVLGDPFEFGVELSGRTAEQVAEGLRKTLPMAQDDDVRARLRRHVEESCSWPKTAAALRAAFA